mgnify:CR=1 FL=1
MRLTKELIENKRKGLIGKTLINCSPLELGTSEIINIDLKHYAVRVRTNEKEYTLFYPYTLQFEVLD